MTKTQHRAEAQVAAYLNEAAEIDPAAWRSLQPASRAVGVQISIEGCAVPGECPEAVGLDWLDITYVKRALIWSVLAVCVIIAAISWGLS